MTPSTTPLGAAREREHGQILVLFAFILIGLLLISALAVDYGGWLLARRTYQNVADEAALAGAYQLTNPIGAACTLAQPSKNHCAREAAWTSVKNALGLGSGLVPSSEADLLGSAPYSEAGYRIWVASPPSDAGAAYTGFASSTKTVFVRVERDLQAGLSRIIKTSTTVGSWATAGRIPENFAIIVLCGAPTCTGPSGQDLQVAGTGSNLILESGDLASNSFGKTSGNSASIALNDGSDGKDVSLAYMHTPSQCAIGSSTCQIDAWHSATQTVDTTKLYSALALPQVIDPQYAKPTLNATTTPYQCYSTTDTPPAISADSPLLADGPTINGAPIDLMSAVQPAPTSLVLLASSTMGGQVTDSVSGTPLNGATVTVVGPNGAISTTTYTATTSGSGGNAGNYSIPGVTPSGTYTITVTLANYATQSFNIDVSDSGPTNRDIQLVPNPGTISGTVTGTVVSNITISTDNGSTTTTSGTGTYTITNVTPGSRVVTPTAPGGYVSTPASLTVSVAPAQNVTGIDFVMSAVPTGTVTGTVSDDTTGLAIPGVTVTITQGAGTGKSGTTNSSGVYTLNSVTTGANQKVTATLAGYANTVSGNFTVTTGTTTVNLTMWPANCGSNGAAKGTWDCDMRTTGTACQPVTNPTAANVSCAAFDNTNRIRPGTYKSITIGNNECAWIDPLGGAPGITAGQTPGVVYVTDTLSIGASAFLFGDGVTIVLDAGAHVDVGASGGFVLNYKDPTNTFGGGSPWRTASSIGGSGVAACTGSTGDLRKGAWTTKTRATWNTAVSPPCYNDVAVNPAEIGMAWYLRDAATCCGGHRFSFSGQMGFLFDGVLYGPKDDIDLGGQGAQAAAGQIVAWTLKYHGDTDIHQRYSGLEVDGPPYLIEPYLGE